uniref:Uncharacterized protein n=1 Tax=Oryza brachyantha TaxID=4533 RepID=J3M5F5_ORYBR
MTRMKIKIIFPDGYCKRMGDVIDWRCGAISATLTMYASSIKRFAGGTMPVVLEDMATVVTSLDIGIAMAANRKLRLVVSFLLPCMLLEGYSQMKFLSGSVKSAKVSGCIQISQISLA